MRASCDGFPGAPRAWKRYAGPAPMSAGLPRTLPLLTSLFVFGLAPLPVRAAPVLGSPLFAMGNIIAVTIENPDSAYTSEVWLLYQGPAPIFIGANRDIGRHIYATVHPYSELIFMICVQETRQSFYTGPGGRNLDGIPHAVVDWHLPFLPSGRGS
jgi:hypothetical protein